MQFLRGAFILLLLIGLPTAAIMGDADRLSRLWSVDAARQTTVADEKAEANEPHDLQLPPIGEQPFVAPEPPVDETATPAVFPKLRSPPDSSAAEPQGRPLRSALYRPSAEDKISIRRVLADSDALHMVNSGTLDDLSHQLRSIGARSYRMVDDQGAYLFVCELAPERPGKTPLRFEARSSEKAAAMRDVIAQVQQWQRSRR